MDFGPHAVFIGLSYAVATLVIAALVLWLLVDGRRQSRRLADLEARGLSRRR